MSVDMSHALRHDECLANPSALAGARWRAARLERNHAVRHRDCLPNPSELRPEGVPIEQGTTWSGAALDIIPSHGSTWAGSFPRRRGKAGMGAMPIANTRPSRPSPIFMGEGGASC